MCTREYTLRKGNRNGQPCERGRHPTRYKQVQAPYTLCVHSGKDRASVEEPLQALDMPCKSYMLAKPRNSPGKSPITKYKPKEKECIVKLFPALFKTHHHCVVCMHVCVGGGCMGGWGRVCACASLREPKDAGSLGAGWP